MTPLPRHKRRFGVYITANWPGAIPCTGSFGMNYVHIRIHTLQHPGYESRCMAVLESDAHTSIHYLLPRQSLGRDVWVGRNPVHVGKEQPFAVLHLGPVTVAHIYHIVPHVLADHVPRSTAQAQTFPLSDGMEPIALVHPDLLPGGYVYDRTGFLAEMAAKEIIIVYLPEETNTLRILACGVGQFDSLGYVTNLTLRQLSQRKHYVVQLLIAYLGQEIGLVLDRIRSGGEIAPASRLDDVRIMPRGRHIELMSLAALEIAELDNLVAHHVRMRRQPLFHGIK